MRHLNRRRFVLLAAGSTAGVAAGGWQCFLNTPTPPSDPQWPVMIRKTYALGTEVSIVTRHPSADLAEQAIGAAFEELALVERLMSIYQPDSQLSVLNRTGHLFQPHPYLVAVLRHARHVSQRTRGAFDVTVQPLWEAFNAAVRQQRLPEAELVHAAKAQVDWSQLAIDDDSVRLLRPGMKVSLNGIAQGFASDRVLAALRAGGVEHALINAGELQPIGRSRRGGSWRVGIQHPRRQDAYIALADLDGRALATSGDYATQFSADCQHHHIFDPATGYSPTELSSVSILAPTGMAADALSTAGLVLGTKRTLDLIKTMPGVDAFLVRKDGETIATNGFRLRSEGSKA